MRNIKDNKKTYPVYVLKGSQDLLIERELQMIRESHIQQLNDFNYFVMDAENSSITEILDNLNTTPMFNKSKMVVVKNCEQLKAAGIKHLEKYIASPSPGIWLVLISRDKKKPPFKKHRNLDVRIFDKADNIEKLIMDESETVNIKLSKEAARLVHDLLGNDLRVIKNEIIKLSQFYEGKTSIDAEDVKKFVSDRTQESVFELTNAVSERNRRKAIAVLAELELQGHDPLSILSTLSWRFRQINQAKQYINDKLPKDEIIRKIGTSRGAFYYLSKHAGNFSFSDLIRIYKSIQESDLKLKSTGQEPYSLISGLVLEICSKK